MASVDGSGGAGVDAAKGGRREQHPGRWLMFGALSVGSPIDAVVRRIRAAIALGFLGDGDRLPREADLARQLGVTVFAIREALGMLRDEGLIETRSGSRGGSFVRRETNRTSLTAGELRRISAAELRDLGDWRQMLTSVSAALAAERGSESSTQRLHRYAAALSSAESELEARRAHGRFHIELAAAAQSRRMTEAQIKMDEEFDWLLGLALSDAGWRATSAAELQDIADAIERRDANAARSAAQAHAASTVATVNALRLETLAGEGSTHAREVDPTLEALGSEVEQVIAAVRASLKGVVTRAREIVAASEFDESELRTGLARIAMAGVVASDLDIDGVAFHTVPGLVPRHEYWMGWWRLTKEGVVADALVLDRRRDDFYDYTAMEFWSGAQEGGFYIQGPYIDYGGANDYILTFSLPAYIGDELVGVATADVQVAALEKRLARWLTMSDGCAVVNAEGRIIVANLVRRMVGDVVRSRTAWRVLDVAGCGWSVMEVDTGSPE
jgi:DNA-binding FadR family transcriptional regulator